MPRHTKGFTLMELMIVIAIISILTTLALPSYQTTLKRARFTEILNAVQPYKTAIAIALQEGTERSELTNGQHDIPASPDPTTNLQSISVENGIITATSTDRIDQATLILTPDENGTRFTISGTCLNKGLCHA